MKPIKPSEWKNLSEINAINEMVLNEINRLGIEVNEHRSCWVLI